MAEEQSGNNDSWKTVVDMLTGYELPDRKKLFEGMKGNEGIPLMHVRFDDSSFYQSGFASDGGWRKDNTDFVMPFYVAGKTDEKPVPAGKYASHWWAYITLLGTVGGDTPPSGDDAPINYEGKSDVLKDGGDRNKDGEAVTWNTTDMAQYIHGSGEALRTVSTSPYSTYGFSNRGRDVTDNNHVALLSFTNTAKAFDRVVTFFKDGDKTLEEWEKQEIGDGSEAWAGTAANLFKHLIHQLSRNYDGYVDQLEARVGEEQQTLDGYSPSSAIGRALAAAQTQLQKEAAGLYDAWLAWRPMSSPQRWLYDLLQKARLELFDHQYDYIDVEISPGYGGAAGSMYAVTMDGFENELYIDGEPYGPPSSIATWKKVGEKAVELWNRDVDAWLSDMAKDSIIRISQVFEDATKAFDDQLTDRDSASLADIAAKEQAEKDRADAKAAADAAREQAEKDRAEAKAAADAAREQAEKDRAEAKAQADADRAEAKAAADEARAQAEKDRAEAKAQADADRAEAKAEQAAAKAEAEKEKAAAKAEQEAAKAEAEKEKAAAKAEQEQEKAEAKKEQEAAKAQAEQDRQMALAQANQDRARADKEREEAKKQAEADRAEAEQEQEAAKAEAEKEKAAAKAEQEQEKAEAEKEREAAKAEAEKEKAAAKAEQEAAKAEAEKEKAAAEAEYKQEKAEAEKEQEAAKAEAEKDRENALGQAETDRAEAKEQAEKDRLDAQRAETQARYELEQEKSEAREQYERDLSESRAERDAQEQEASRKESEARAEYDKAVTEAQQDREAAAEQAQKERAEAKAEYDRQIASGQTSAEEARAQYDQRIEEINAAEQAALDRADSVEEQAREEYDQARAEAQQERNDAREEAEGARQDARFGYDQRMDDIQARYDQVGAGNPDMDQLIRERIESLPNHTDPSATPYSPYSDAFGGAQSGQQDPAAALGRDSTGSPGGAPPPMMPPMGGAGGGQGGSNGERNRNVLDSAINRASPRGPGSSADQDNLVRARGVQTTSGTPFTPAMAGGGPGDNGQATQSGDRERTNWLTEDEDVWGTDEGGAPQALGR